MTAPEYLLRGELVSVPVRWNGKTNPDLPRLRALLPLARTRPNGPRNVEIELPDGTRQVRPFRGLRRLPEPEPVWTQTTLGECGDGYGWQPPTRTVHTIRPLGDAL